MSRAWKAGLAGVAAAVVAQFVALLLTGAGHGWIPPFWFSLWLWPLLPLTLIRLGQRRSHALDTGLIMLALALDAALVVATIDEGTEYFRPVITMGWPVVAVWLALWLSWQVGALILRFRKA